MFKKKNDSKKGYSMELTSKIYIAGHRGLVGSNLYMYLKELGYTNIITKTSLELDLRNQQQVNIFFEKEQPEYVFLAAAKVGGIGANMTYPATFIYDNLMIETNIIHASYVNNVKKLLFLGSSCIYPKETQVPIQETSLLTGPLEPTNQAYAISKIAGIEMIKAYRKQYGVNFISAMPTNVYGIGDTYDAFKSHVIPSLILKMHHAKMNHHKEVQLWGTGKPKREFINAYDLSKILVELMLHYDEEDIINVGTGEDISIKNLATMIQEVIGFDGHIHFDTSMPDGTMEKTLDVTKMKLYTKINFMSLKDGLIKAYQDFLNQQS
jgi:GDP-L-fucose synthase